MRSSALLLAFAALAWPAAVHGAPPSIHVVVELDDDTARVIDARASHRPAPALVPLDDPRSRIAEWADDHGKWQGRPVQTAIGSVSLILPASAAGTVVQMEIGDRIVDVFVPDPGDEARGEEVDPEVIEFQISGSPETRQDIVFLAEGYTELERDVFIEDVEETLAYLVTIEPYDRYLPLVNIYGVFFASVESGADHLELSPQTSANTAMGCYYGAYDIDRLIVCNAGSVLSLASWAPGDDVRIVLVNDPAHGGSGGSDYAVASASEEMVRIVAHEMAHTDGGLADEYDYGYAADGKEKPLPNCHWDSDGVPWEAWIDAGSPGVDAFVVCSFEDYYRPTDTACSMNTLQDQFCVVCREQLVRTIYAHIDSLVIGWSAAPSEAIGPGGSVSLSVSLLEVGGPPLHVRWTREDDVVLAEGAGLTSVEIDGGDLVDGVQTITATVEDNLGWVLTNTPSSMDEEVTWEVDVLPGVGGDDDDDDDDAADDDDDDDGGSACSGCSDDDDDGGGGGGFGRVGFVAPLFLLRRRRRRRGSPSGADTP